MRLNIVLNEADEANLDKVYSVLHLEKGVIGKADIIRQCLSTVSKQTPKGKERRHIIIPDDIISHDDIVKYLGIDKLSKAYVSLREKIKFFYE